MVPFCIASNSGASSCSLVCKKRLRCSAQEAYRCRIVAASFISGETALPADLIKFQISSAMQKYETDLLKVTATVETDRVADAKKVEAKKLALEPKKIGSATEVRRDLAQRPCH